MKQQKSVGKILLIVMIFFGLPMSAVSQENAESQIASTRSNPENFEAAPQLTDPKQILKGVPHFTVDDRTDYLENTDFFPCSDCHDNEEQVANKKVRVLEEEHETINLVHGKGRFWCLTCHSAEDRDSLVDLKNQKISFNDSYLLCGQCHFQRQQDFFNGGHGKRKDQWLGERKLTTCTECHNPHVPQIQQRKPVAKPKLRTGLTASTNH